MKYFILSENGVIKKVSIDNENDEMLEVNAPEDLLIMPTKYLYKKGAIVDNPDYVPPPVPEEENFEDFEEIKP